MRDCKIVFSGTTGAGKTTAIAAISESPPISTEVANNDPSLNKATTTVGLDFGLLTLENGDRVRLFGTPGQARFDFMWRILVKDALGLVILIDNSRPEPLADLSVYLDGFAADLARIPCVVGVGRLESHPVPGIDAFAAHLEQRGLLLPVIPVDARERADVLMLIDVLVAQAEADLAQGAA